VIKTEAALASLVSDTYRCDQSSGVVHYRTVFRSSSLRWNRSRRDLVYVRSSRSRRPCAERR